MINLSSYSRGQLTVEEQEFFAKLVPLAQLIQHWTYVKADFRGVPSRQGALTSLIVAEILIASDFGRHPVAQSELNSKYSNNLVLLPAGGYWKGKIQLYGGQQYRAYKTWRNFAEDYSDYLCFSKEHDNLLISTSFVAQSACLALTKPSPIVYNRSIIQTINRLGLEEFDGQAR